MESQPFSLRCDDVGGYPSILGTALVASALPKKFKLRIGPLAEQHMPEDPYSLIQQLEANISRAVYGKEDVVKMCVVALLAGEHVLLEDVPGVGKTLMAKALARSVSGSFARIQFTPDLLPSDIVGSSIYNSNQGSFHFHRGALFANIVLADEINRTPPRTQSALLEAMSDRQVSADGDTYRLPSPFMVVATQNPFEFEGTYPLPESQLDRFLMRISMGYPARDAEKRVLESHREQEPVELLEPVVSADQVTELQAAVRHVTVEDSIHDYLLNIVAATRESDELHVGVSTRGALSLYRASQSLALARGRDFVVPDDVKDLTVPAFSHRVISKGFLHGGQRDAVEGVMRRIVDTVPVPA
jgi:MoxR-like ATPase